MWYVDKKHKKLNFKTFPVISLKNGGDGSGSEKA
nr:MAG TPA: hypothetical protein [Caudoviricetes sp.]